MKSEDVILQEMERERQEKLAAEDGQQATPANEKTTKFMISGEAPVLMSKACELMIKDLSFRAWRHTERNRRRTLQKQDLHAAVGESEVYDFLIDIVPRVTTTTPKIQHAPHIPAASVPGNAMMPSLPVGMSVAAGMPVGIPATLTQPSAQSGTVIDHANAGMMQLMGTAPHHAQQQPHLTQHQAVAQFHQDPSQQLVVGAPQAMPPGMHPHVVQHPPHMQQTFAGIPPVPGAPIPAGAAVAMPVPGAPSAYDPSLTTAAPGTATTASQGDAPQWSSAPVS